MHGFDASRTRDARLINGVMLLGGRSVSTLEVEIALGLDTRPGQTSGLRTWLRALVAAIGWKRPGAQAGTMFWLMRNRFVGS